MGNRRGNSGSVFSDEVTLIWWDKKGDVIKCQ